MADHRPDRPFGCSTTWGPNVFPPGRGSGLMLDMLLHTCNGPHGHPEACICKCGAEFVPPDGPA